METILVLQGCHLGRLFPSLGRYWHLANSHLGELGIDPNMGRQFGLRDHNV